MRVFHQLTLLFLLFFFPVVTFGQDAYKVTAPKLNVRNKPSTQALVVGVLNQGETISVSEIVDGWATFSFKGKTRYVNASFIELVKKVDIKDVAKPDTPSKPKDERVEQSVTPTPTKLSDFKKQKKAKEKHHKGRMPSTNFGDRFTLVADVFGGVSTFDCSLVTPKVGIGFGGDIGLQCDYNKLWDKLPKCLYGEIDLGYACKGSAAFPIHYAGTHVLPLGYRCYLNPMLNFVGRAGAYIEYPFSELDTRYNTYSANLDIGVSIGIGAEWKQFGMMVLFERGFTEVTDGGSAELYNQGLFLTVSYKFLSF